MDDEIVERESLAAATRALIRAVRVTDVEPAAMAKARALIDEAAGLLSAETYDGPHSQMGFGAVGQTASFTGPPNGFFPCSPVVGACNPLSPPVELDVVEEPVDGVATTVVTGRVTLTEAYNGPPWDLTHGGVIALIFDELLGATALVGGVPGYTGRLTVHYRKPTPILEELELRGWVERAAGRKTLARGEIRAGSAVTAEAEGLFIRTGSSLSS